MRLRTRADELVRKVRRFHPRVLAVVGVGAYRFGFEEQRPKLGPQRPRWIRPRSAFFPTPLDLTECFRAFGDAILDKVQCQNLSIQA